MRASNQQQFKIREEVAVASEAISALKQAISNALVEIKSFASQPEFSSKMGLIFGKDLDFQSLNAAWLADDFSFFPSIEIRSATAIDGANGAYSKDTNTIYLAAEFLSDNQHNFAPIVDLLLEEIGHRIDSLLTATETPGDEGELFAALVQNRVLSAEEIARIKAENDIATVNLDGQLIENDSVNASAASYLAMVRGESLSSERLAQIQAKDDTATVNLNRQNIQIEKNQDTWEQLSDVPFEFGVSAGGGLATDGQFIYAADFSGDGNNDYIDLNQDLVDDPRERFDALNIANGSVRFARYNPATETWESLPTLNELGVNGDAFSAGNLNNPLFVAGNKLYYYQFRAGPNIAALYSYDLAQGLSGIWTTVWEHQNSDEPFIGVNAGLKGLDVNGEPVIIHHIGGGEYKFARIDDIDNGGSQTQLSPTWNFTSEHFPRNGSWEYDPINDRIFHLSGNQLIQWDRNDAVYGDGSFLTSVPDDTNPLALETIVIESLETELGWQTGSTAEDPGTSLWGNSLVIVNDPNGSTTGPNGQDTGDNVLYLLRGESSVDGWPFNEGRGLVNNGDFARVFLDTGEVQVLNSTPFNIGKGSTAIYLDGYLYVTQGDTLTVADDAGNIDPLNGEGVRSPGQGFARFKVDADFGELSFSQTNYTINENGTTTAEVTIIRTEGSDGEVSVTVNLTNGSAIAPDDYSNEPIVVTLADRQTSKTVSIPLVDDGIFEATENLNLTLTDPTDGATLGSQTTATLNIIDNDAVPGTLNFAAASYQVNEAEKSLTVTVTRTEGSDGKVSATVLLNNGTAIAGDDYVATPIIVEFANGETSKTVTIPLIDDSVLESDETINLTLANPTGGVTLGGQNTAVVTINDKKFFGKTLPSTSF